MCETPHRAVLGTIYQNLQIKSKNHFECLPPWLNPDEPDRRIFLSRGSTWKVLLRRCELAAVILVARFCPSKDIHSFKEGRGSQTSPTPTDHGAVQLTQHTGLFWTQLAAVQYESHVHRHLNVSRGYHVPVSNQNPSSCHVLARRHHRGDVAERSPCFFFLPLVSDL